MSTVYGLLDLRFGDGDTFWFDLVSCEGLSYLRNRDLLLSLTFCGMFLKHKTSKGGLKMMVLYYMFPSISKLCGYTRFTYIPKQLVSVYLPLPDHRMLLAYSGGKS